jgi:hypothetical protein
VAHHHSTHSIHRQPIRVGDGLARPSCASRRVAATAYDTKNLLLTTTNHVINNDEMGAGAAELMLKI